MLPAFGIRVQNSLRFATVIAATTAMATDTGVRTCNRVPLDFDADNRPTDDADVTVPAFNTAAAMAVKAFAGIDRNIFTCAFLHTDVVAYLEATEQLQTIECCTPNQKAMWGDYGTPDGKYLGMWIYECDAIQPVVRLGVTGCTEGKEAGDGTQDTEDVLVYPSIFGRHGGFMFSNVSTP